MGNSDDVKVAVVKLADERSQTTQDDHNAVGCGGGVRRRGAAAQIKPSCRTGKQSGYNRLNVTYARDLYNTYRITMPVHR